MEFRKMAMITLYVRQQKRHRCIEQSFRLWEKARVGWFERIALKHVYYHMWKRSPVQVWRMRQGAQGWCTGMTQRNGMGREVGGGFRMGNTCTPMADSCQCMAKPLQYCKVISLQLKKKNPQGKEMQKGKMALWGGLTNSCDKKRCERQRRKGKIYPFQCRVPKINKER